MAERPLWTPSPERMEEANLTRFARQAIRDWKLGLNDYPAFYLWTIDHPEQFWDSLWKFASVRASAKGARVLVDGHRMPGARWYPEARLNFAENLLRRRDASTAIVFWGEDKIRRRLTHRELYEQVSRVAQGLRASGVKPGDRVAAFCPTCPKRSPRCSPRRASARPSRRVPPISGSRACSTASARSPRRCSSRPTGT